MKMHGEEERRTEKHTTAHRQVPMFRKGWKGGESFIQPLFYGESLSLCEHVLNDISEDKIQAR